MSNALPADLYIHVPNLPCGYWFLECFKKVTQKGRLVARQYQHSFSRKKMVVFSGFCIFSKSAGVQEVVRTSSVYCVSRTRRSLIISCFVFTKGGFKSKKRYAISMSDPRYVWKMANTFLVLSKYLFVLWIFIYSYLTGMCTVFTHAMTL